MRGCTCLLPLLGLVLVLGTANTAFAQLGACADPFTGGTADLTVPCMLGLSQMSCDNLGGVWQGDGTTACRDCDCNGADDAKEVQACVDACSPPATVAACLATCSDNAAADGAPLSCPASNDDGTNCCDQLTGIKTTISDGFSCTDDSCNADGTVTNAPNDGTCNTLFVDGVCDSLVCGPADLGGAGYDAASGCNRINDAAGTSCAGNGVGDCTGADTCNGAGVCDDNDEADGPAPAGLCDDGNLCTADNCAAGACANPDEAPGTACQDGPLSDPCDAADTCGAGGNSGVCIDRKKADGPEAGCADGDPCTTDVCTAGACDNSGAEADGTPCHVGDPLAGPCDAADSCCAGVCVDIVESSGTSCEGATGECWDQATCGGGAPGCGFGNINNGAASIACNDNPTASGTNCGSASQGPCDRQDKCDGAGACDPRPRAAGFVCRASAGSCDIVDECDGTETDPCTDVVEPAGLECRATSGNSAICDPPEACDGVSGVCPTDVVHTGGVLACEGDGNECTNDRCGISGSFTTCFHVASEADGDPCTTGNGAGVCTDPDTCLAGACLDNDLADSFANACDDSNACTVDDHCDGANGCHGGTAAHPFGTDLTCSDPDPCIVNGCDPATGCTTTLVGSSCGDLLCTYDAGTTDSFTEGCLSIDLLVTDASASQTGINCAFKEVTLGSPGCPLTVTDVRINTDLFPEFNNFFQEPPNKVFDVGGCTNEGGVGAGEWVVLATIDVIAPQDECTASISPFQSPLTASSLIGQGAVAMALDPGAASGPIAMHCFGDLYDHNGDGFVNPADLSMFATAWPPEAYNATFDYNKSGAIDAGDVSFFATAMERFTCAGGIVLPCEQTNCGCTASSSAGSQGYLQEADGTLTEVWVKPASKQQLRAFGLTSPNQDSGRKLRKSRRGGAAR